jgi:hypothetical protein
VLWLLSTGVILLAPAVIGLFWGAPLIARELETGTAVRSWTRSCSWSSITCGLLTASSYAWADG